MTHATAVRRSIVWRGWAAVLMAVTATVSVLVATPAASSATDTCLGNYTPVLKGQTINQGMGTDTPLTRGKTTLVRLFIQEPVCATAGEVQLTSATLTATDGTWSATVGTTPSTLGPVYPSFDTNSTTVLPNSPGDPMFEISNFDACPSGVTCGQTTATFTAKVNYSSPSGTGTLNLPTNSILSPITATVAPKSNALRVLVIPMGDSTKAMSTEFPEARNGGAAVNGEYADTAVQNAMQAMSRLMPVPDTVGDLTSTTAGLRYRLDDTTILDLPSLGIQPNSAGQFCLGASAFVLPTSTPNVASKLSGDLQAWNSNNPSAQADRVLGVIWQNVSQGAANGCAEGMASIGNPVGFFRDFVDNNYSTPNPSMSGAIASMELSHTWGSVTLSDSRDTLQDHHSANVTADPNNTQRGYNLSLAQWLSSPVSDMHYSGSSATTSSWNNNTAVFESPDYLFNQCELTPGEANCPSGTSTGSVGVAAAGGSFIQLHATTDGTPAGTAAYSYIESPGQATQDAPVSTYHLIQLSSTGATTRNDPIVLSGPESDHDSGTGSALAPVPSTDGVINAVVPLCDGTALGGCSGTTASFELVNGSSVLYYRTSLQAAPQITSVSGSTGASGFQDFTNAPGDETAPALSPTGQIAAWTTASGVVVQARNASTNLPSGQPSAPVSGAMSPSWSPNGSQLAYADASGDIFVASVTTTNPPVISGNTEIYNHLLQTPPPTGSTAASHPSYSPDGSHLAVAINGFIWDISTTGGANSVICDLSSFLSSPTCQPLTTASTLPVTAPGNDSAPAWGTAGGTSGGGLVAFDRGADIWTLDPSNAANTQVDRIAGAGQPSWGGSLVGYAQAGNIWVANSSSVASSGAYLSLTQLTTGGQDTSPALAGNASAIGFDRNTGGTNGHDIFDGTLNNSNSTLRWTATSPTPANLRSDLYIQCASAEQPIDVDLYPTSVSGNTATFTYNYPQSRGCPGGTVGVRVTDGYQITALTPLFTIPGTPGTCSAPSAAIADPTSGGTFLQYDPIIAQGSNVNPCTGTNGGNFTFSWSVTGPVNSGPYTGVQVEIPVPSGGRKPGTYTLTLTVTNTSTGQKGTTTSTYTVLPDPNHLGSNVGVTFNPQTLYIPSSGNDVTLTVVPEQQNLSQINASTVEITQVGNYATAIPVDTSSGTTGWASNGNGSYTAKFNRLTLTCFMYQKGLVGFYVPVVLTASASTFSIQGYDPINPVTSLNTSPPTC